jgi:hypothetical protein
MLRASKKLPSQLRELTRDQEGEMLADEWLITYALYARRAENPPTSSSAAPMIHRGRATK